MIIPRMHSRYAHPDELSAKFGHQRLYSTFDAHLIECCKVNSYNIRDFGHWISKVVLLNVSLVLLYPIIDIYFLFPYTFEYS